MASENPEKKFLYDIIYCDKTRLSPLISQLNAHGLPKDITVTESTGSGGAMEAGGTAGWIFAAKAEAGGKIMADITEGVAQETQYDPYWATVLEFADQAITLAKRHDFEIGRLCLISGGLSVADVSSLRDILKLAVAKENMIQGMVDDFETGSNSEKKRQAKKSFEQLEEVVSLYSGSVQGVLSSISEEYWMSIDREHLIFPAEEIILKFGAVIPGKWSILGVYDSAPAITPEINVAGDAGIQGIIMGLAPVIRGVVGKKDHQHSITPLMIMREV